MSRDINDEKSRPRVDCKKNVQGRRKSKRKTVQQDQAWGSHRIARGHHGESQQAGAGHQGFWWKCLTLVPSAVGRFKRAVVHSPPEMPT